MPAGDGTGPVGLGPMTGRAAGYCAGYGVPGFMNPLPARGLWTRPPFGLAGYPGAFGYGPWVPYGAPRALSPYRLGRGWGRGFGRGRGWGRGWWFAW